MRLWPFDRSADQAATLRSRLRSGAGPATAVLLTILAFTAGVLWFTPWAKVWTRGLESASESLGQALSPAKAGLTWQAVDRAGPFSFRVKGLTVNLGDKTLALTVNSAQIGFGLNPLVSIRLVTGPELRILAGRDGNVSFDGELNLTSLLGFGPVQGRVRLAGRAQFTDYAAAPVKGWLELRAGSLTLSRGARCRDLSLMLELEDRGLRIRTVSFLEPFNLRGEGFVTLDPENILASTYSIEGDIALGGAGTHVRHSGRIEQFFGEGV